MIPDYQSLMLPVPEVVGHGGVFRSREVKEALADKFITAEERAELLPSGRQGTFDNRVGWAMTYLAQAGLIERPKRAHVQITELGRQLLATSPTRVDNAMLRRYPSFLEFQRRTKDPAPEGLSHGDALGAFPDEEADAPSELIRRATRANRAAVESEVLDAALGLSPVGFEELVIHLLAAMGYGKSGSLERTSATGDAGVDGIISQDPLGLDRIYVQAKRYAVENSVDRPRIHEFAGALLGKQGDRGVFITTSAFTQGAIREAERINARIELIDGRRLAQLLVTYGVGVQVEESVSLFRLDEDFFEVL